MMNSVRLSILFFTLTAASFSYASEGGNMRGKMAEPVEHSTPKPKMAARVGNANKDENRIKNVNNQTASNFSEFSPQHPKKPLTKEERQALRRQINQAGGYYPN